eukprot:SAG31_NODE_6199_length_2127_cov_1.691815_1_plen_75_part_10
MTAAKSSPSSCSSLETNGDSGEVSATGWASFCELLPAAVARAETKDATEVVASCGAASESFSEPPASFLLATELR